MLSGLFAFYLSFVCATVYLTVPDALKKVFPPAAVVKEKTKFLSEKELSHAREELKGVPVESALVTYYEAKEGERWIGSAYLDTHQVRTLPETVLISIHPDGKIDQVQILSFKEPPDYLPPSRWLGEIHGKEQKEFGEKGAIRSITGATLTARAIEQAVKRVLTFHEIIYGKK